MAFLIQMNSRLQLRDGKENAETQLDEGGRSHSEWTAGKTDLVLKCFFGAHTGF